MTEPDVTLTDFFLAGLCLFFGLSLWRLHSSRKVLAQFWIGFFLASAVAAFLGALVHGFFLDEASNGYHFLWASVLISLAFTAAMIWCLGGYLFCDGRHLRFWLTFAATTFLMEATFILFFNYQEFRIAIDSYIPASLLLFYVSLRNFIKLRSREWSYLLIAIGAGFFAALIQVEKWGLHPIYFNHNSTYHLIQALSLVWFWKGAHIMLRKEKYHG